MSGSAAVTIKPITKAVASSRGRLFLLVRAAPLLSHIGWMLKSTPRRKSVSPKIRIRPLITKRTRKIFSRGAAVKPRNSTIRITGRTETAVSLNFNKIFITKNSIP